MGYERESEEFECVRVLVADAVGASAHPDFRAVVSQWDLSSDIPKPAPPSLVWVDDSYMYMRPDYFRDIKKSFGSAFENVLAFWAGHETYHVVADLMPGKSPRTLPLQRKAQDFVRGFNRIEIQEHYTESSADIFGLLCAAEAGLASNAVLRLFDPDDFTPSCMYPSGHYRNELVHNAAKYFNIF